MTQPNTTEAVAPQRLTLLPGEVDVVSMEFARRLMPASGAQAAETIFSVSLPIVVAGQTSPPLAIGTPVISGSQVQIPVSGQQPGNTYQIQVLIQTNLGRFKKGLGWLVVPTIPS